MLSFQRIKVVIGNWIFKRYFLHHTQIEAVKVEQKRNTGFHIKEKCRANENLDKIASPVINRNK